MLALLTDDLNCTWYTYTVDMVADATVLPKPITVEQRYLVGGLSKAPTDMLSWQRSCLIPPAED